MDDSAQAPPDILEYDVPSLFVDGAVGAAWVNGMHRILLAEFVVNPHAGATKPGIRHVANLIISPESLRELISYLQTLPSE